MGYFDTKSYNMSTATIQKVKDDLNWEKALHEVKDKLIDIEKKMSFFLPYSEISRINDNSGVNKVLVSEDTLEVVKNSVKYSELTNGIFDITMGPIISEWGIFSDNERIPENEEIKKLMKLVNYKDIEIDEKEKTIMLKKKGQKIDLGGIAKGYATDVAIEIYKKYGISSAMINIGGNVSVLGRKEDNEPWNVGIQNPNKERGEIIAIVQCEDESVVTSGNYVRNYKVDNKIYGHIMNSKSGLPVDNDLGSVTIISKKAIDADALTTTLFSMGFEGAINFINSMKHISVVLITNKNEVYVSDSLRDKFHIIDNEKFDFYYIL